jgi:DNA-binding transcriptional ArsR family regulator
MGPPAAILPKDCLTVEAWVMAKKPDATTAEAVSSLRAVAHPLRLRILSLLTGTEMSAAEIARELDISHANASYHLRQLAAAELLVEAGEEKIRGGVAKRYRHPWRSQGTGGKPTSEDKRLYIQAIGDELVRRFDSRRPRTKQFLSDAEMWVEPDTWNEVMALLAKASELMHTRARPPRSEGTIHVNATSIAFQMLDRPGDRDDTKNGTR